MPTKQSPPIKLFISDVDGVLTDGHLHYAADGELFKSFHVQDGQGLVMLKKANIQIAIISGNDCKIIQHRCHALGINQVFLDVKNKLSVYQQIKHKHRLTDAEIVCVGDDVPDIPIIQQAGIGIAVANAHESVKSKANWITQKTGGHGAVREICDWLISKTS